MVQENATNAEFHSWYSNYSKITPIFTLLAAADVEVLSILSSKFAEFLAFSISASFSAKTETWMFVNLEDVPQLVIQVIVGSLVLRLFKFKLLLTFSIVIMINLVERGYHVSTNSILRNRCRNIGSSQNNLSLVS